jgi:sec-independent protein translocase protein TatA
MFDIGWPELLLISGMALMLFGANKLPEVAKSLGKSIKGFKQGLKEGLEDKDDEGGKPSGTPPAA